jgi:hypothetical protein
MHVLQALCTKLDVNAAAAAAAAAAAGPGSVAVAVVLLLPGAASHLLYSSTRQGRQQNSPLVL